MSRGQVVDASVLFHALSDRGPLGIEVRAGLPEDLHVPQLARYELVHAVRKAERRGALSPSDSRAVMRAAVSVSLIEWPLEPFAERIWQLRHNVTTFDASYVALAEHLGVPLVTRDERLARAPGIRCEVIVPA